MEGSVIGSEPKEEMANPITEDLVQIRDVWNENLDEEFEMIKSIAEDPKFVYVAMDTEFPGNVFKRHAFQETYYEFLKMNVNHTKLIQLGLTFFDEKGNLPTCGTGKYCVWQFNFREFDELVDKHACAPESIELLKKHGIKFDEFKEKGVDIHRFGELLMSSGIVMKDPTRLNQVHWIVFHGSFDFGYVVKLLRGERLPETQERFLELLETYIPNFYDVKYVIKFTDGLYGGLQDAAIALRVQRIGASHQAGSDSLLTGLVFMKLKENHSTDRIEKYARILNYLEPTT
ncbi:hypothetical protein TIFTF001_026043 [Ficus carica]|uniref:poly(A)-specific ribonuclease n=1 Tax=Ficus carica TaxID=3494 RepID=A0AA88DG10_FICCA|nr:hypothetical protein TIFTF001_026043 [Ficus carica]